MKIKILAEGGAMKPGPALSQKLGPAGIPLNKVIEQVNEATKEFRGLTIPVELDVDMGTKNFEIKVFSPPVSGLLKKELGIEKASGIQKKMQVGNLAIEQIISIAKSKLPGLLCRDLKSAVKTIVGSCVSLGILVENKPASEVEQQIESGKYDKEILEGRTEVPPEKKAKLDKYFAKLSETERKRLKQEEAEKEAAQEAKEATQSKEKSEENKPEEKKK